MRISFGPIILLPLLAACGSAPQIGHDIGEHRFGEAFTTPSGRMEMIEEKALVTFIEVVEDSRCPRQVTCIWQGAAKVKLAVMTQRLEGPPPDDVAEKGIPHEEIVLSSAPAANRAASIDGFRIELLDVTPYPETAAPIDPDAYRVKLRVTRE